MSNFDHSASDDPLDVLLGAQPAQVSGLQLRQALLGQTLAVVRRRQRVRQLARAVAMAACFVAGIVANELRRDWSATPSASQPAIARTPVKKTQVQVVSMPATGAIKPAKTSRYDHLRRQADRELHDPRLLSAATTKYARAIALASAEQRAVAPDQDSWLMMALKLDPAQEKKHVRVEKN